MCVCAHAGLAGHRGVGPTTDSLKAFCVWSDMVADIKFFVAFRLIAINYPTVNVCSEAEADALALANQMGGGIDLPLEKSRRES